jgi:hypothetical protein
MTIKMKNDLKDDDDDDDNQLQPLQISPPTQPAPLLTTTSSPSLCKNVKTSGCSSSVPLAQRRPSFLMPAQTEFIRFDKRIPSLISSRSLSPPKIPGIESKQSGEYIRNVLDGLSRPGLTRLSSAAAAAAAAASAAAAAASELQNSPLPHSKSKIVRSPFPLRQRLPDLISTKDEDFDDEGNITPSNRNVRSVLL